MISGTYNKVPKEGCRSLSQIEHLYRVITKEGTIVQQPDLVYIYNIINIILLI